MEDDSHSLTHGRNHGLLVAANGMNGLKKKKKKSTGDVSCALGY
jgi:hypothetical protein